MKAIMEIWSDEYISKDSTYFNHVGKFIRFLKLPEINMANQPASITYKDLDKSVGYYVEQGNINSINSMNSHLESIKAFYNYLIKCGYTNTNIVPIANYTEFKEELIEKYNLKERIEREWIQDDDIKLILDKLDYYFDNTNYTNLNYRNKERYMHWMCLRIYLKVCLLAPAKKSVLLDLKYDSFYDNFRGIIVNGINIKIPNGLRNNILFSIKFVEDVLIRKFTYDNRIFEYITNKVGGEIDKSGTSLNRWFCSFLKEYNILDIAQDNDSYSVEIIGNSTIHNMVIQGTNPYYISQITGITISSLESKYYNKIDKINYIRNVDTELNNSISSCEYYHYI